MANPRADFVPIIDRPPLTLPDDLRLAVMLVVNVEQKEFDQPVGSLQGQPGNTKLPEVPLFSVFEYGLRVGIWRMLEATKRLEISISMTLNGSVGDSYPGVVEACMQAGWDPVGHGYHQVPLNLVDDERAEIRKTLDAIERQTGKRPQGWLGPGLQETFDTPDILADEGVRYVLDWVNDDQPYPLKVKTGTLTSLPYSNEINDIGIYLRGGHKAPEMLDRVEASLSTLLSDTPQTARILPIAVHPFIMGQPHRFPTFVKILEMVKNHPGVAFMTATQIYEWYAEATA
jgi:peptidoglycan/xylan/chitin deacetylase (PgdA/CDA1 family)